ncbi:MAG: HAMP domain-containing protein, partial [Deltaproteobacteria bacterium]|nr:HAMP domain-containing protein [Deltaproteobacteria bacterium]
TFNQKYLGDIQVGISLDFIEEQISKEKLFILMMSLGIILLAVGVAVYLGIGFSRPISELVTATHEISEGNLHFRVHIAQNDELGDLGKAFNIMAGDLHKKALMEKSFGSYVSPEILEMILDNPENPWVKGTRNQASVVFTDVRGFTAFSEVTEPEVVVESLNEYFSIGTDVVLEYNGYIDKFIGDAILAVFGVPVSQEDHAMRAVKASFEMQERLMDAAKKKGIELLAKIGIGINSGVVVAGNIGSTKKMEYTVIGDTVNTASRLNGLAGNGEVVISKDTLDRLGGKVKVEALPPAKVKGKTELIEVFKVLKI